MRHLRRNDLFCGLEQQSYPAGNFGREVVRGILVHMKKLPEDGEPGEGHTDKGFMVRFRGESAENVMDEWVLSSVWLASDSEPGK